MFRWKGIATFAGILALFFIISLFFIDKWMEETIEYTGSSLNGAKVEIDNFHFSLFEVYIKWDRLQVTDKNNTMKNIMETGQASLDLEFWPLLSGKIIVEDMSLTDILSGTDRSIDGKLDEEIAETEQNGEPGLLSNSISYLQEEAEKNVIPDLSKITENFDPDQLVKTIDLQSVHKMDSLKEYYQTRYDYWDSTFKTIKIDSDAKELERMINSVNVNKLDNAIEITNAIKKVEKIKKKVEELQKTYENTSKDIQADLKDLEHNSSDVTNWINDDYKKLYDVAQIPDLSVENIAKMLFGSAYVNRISQYIGYVQLARSYMNSDDNETEKEESPPRLKGQDIRFTKRNARPDYWVKSASVSGQTETQIVLSGEISHIVSNQKQIGKPTNFDLSGISKEGAKASITGTFDYLGDIPKEEFILEYSGFSLDDYHLADSPLIPKKIGSGVGSISSKFSFSGDSLMGKIHFVAQNITFQKDENPSEDLLTKLVANTLRKMDRLVIDVSVYGIGGQLSFTLNSNLDNKLKEAFKENLYAELEKIKAQLRSRVDEEINKHKKELSNLTDQYKNGLTNQLGNYDQVVDKQMKNVDGKKKELEKKLGVEGDVQKQLENKLKDILKF